MDGVFSGGVSPASPAWVGELIRSYYRVEGHFSQATFLANLRDPGGYFHWDIRTRLGEIVAPTLVLAGADDKTVPPSLTEALARRLPNARYRLVEHIGHYLPIEQPQRFDAAVRDFLGSLAPMGK